MTISLPQPTQVHSIVLQSGKTITRPLVQPPTVPDDFNSAYLKEVIPDLYNEMLNNSAMGPIFNAYFPNGIDTTKFGKIIRINYKSLSFSTHLQLLSRIPVMIGRNYKQDNLILKVRVIREVVDYTAYNNYLLAVHFIDLNVKECWGVAKKAENACLFASFTPYDSTQGDFKSYLMAKVQEFNTLSNVTDFLTQRKEFYDRFKKAGSRF